jgi:tetratricopeptide (TPR) repeat protein
MLIALYVQGISWSGGSMRYSVILVCIGLLIGSLTIFLPGGLLERQDEDDLANLEQLSREEVMKKIDAQRVEAVRLASDKHYPEAVSILLHLIDINHYDQFDYTQLARIAKDLGNDGFEQLLAAEEKSRPIYDSDRIRGAVYYQSDQLPLAERAINTFLDHYPDDLAATFYKGAILRKTNRLKEALALLTSVIEREKTYFFAYLELLELYEATGDKVMAQRMLDLATENNPSNNKNAICHGVGDRGDDGAT